MPLETPARIVRTLVGRGYNAEREAVTLIAGSDDPGRTLARVVEAAPDDALRITADHVREVLASAPAADPSGTEP
ncbi:DNA polymerase II small subunit, partial [Haloferax sp. BAB-2207]